MIGRNGDVNTETSLDQMLLPSDTSFEIFQDVQKFLRRTQSSFPSFSFVLNFKAKANKIKN
jgi:hypothetical protein